VAYRVGEYEQAVVLVAEEHPCMRPEAAGEQASRHMGTAAVVVEIHTLAVVVVGNRGTWVVVAGRIACWDPGGRREVVGDCPYLGIRGIAALGHLASPLCG